MRIDVQTPAGTAWIELDVPARASALLALTHGAGGGVETADLLAIREAAVAAGIAVALITQAYRVRGRGAPPKPEPQDAAWLSVVAVLRAQKKLSALALVVGGRSNGARVACRTARAAGASAVVALAFPLRPPGKPEKSRLYELESTGLPTLLVQGDRDSFGMPPQDPRWQRVVVAGDHSLKKDPAAVAAAVVDFVRALE